MIEILLLVTVAIVVQAGSTTNVEPDSQDVLEKVNYVDLFAPPDSEESSRGPAIRCLSGRLVNRNDREFIQVSVLLDRRAYSAIASSGDNAGNLDQEYVLLDDSRKIKQCGKFVAISRPVLLQRNDLEMPVFVGLIELEAEVVLADEVMLDQALLTGKVTIPVSREWTSAIASRRFAVFLNDSD